MLQRLKIADRLAELDARFHEVGGHVERGFHQSELLGRTDDDGGIDAAAQGRLRCRALGDEIGGADLHIPQRQRTGECAVGAQLVLAGQAGGLRSMIECKTVRAPGGHDKPVRARRRMDMMHRAAQHDVRARRCRGHIRHAEIRGR
ncbi:MAG: hypothetical protein QM760_16355 [Nibricoccus sp.]